MHLKVATGLLMLGFCSCLSATPGTEQNDVTEGLTEDVSGGWDMPNVESGDLTYEEGSQDDSIADDQIEVSEGDLAEDAPPTDSVWDFVAEEVGTTDGQSEDQDNEFPDEPAFDISDEEPIDVLEDADPPITCGGTACPVIVGYTAICNDKQACEYTGGNGSPTILVPGGTFWMGCNEAVDGQCREEEKPYHEVILSDYWIDRDEATQSGFKACRDEGGCQSDPKCYWDPVGKGTYPVVCIDWPQAEEYCEWKCPTCRLCTEAEWERAARGTDGRKYPWSPGASDCPASWDDKCSGTEWTSGTANANCSDTECHDAFSNTAPSGSVPGDVSPIGARDMAGNVQECVADWYGSDYYCKGPSADTSGSPSWTYCGGAPAYSSSWKDPQGPGSGLYRVYRGGTYSLDADYMRVNRRMLNDPSGFSEDRGIRCCRSP